MALLLNAAFLTGVMLTNRIMHLGELIGSTVNGRMRAHWRSGLSPACFAGRVWAILRPIRKLCFRVTLPRRRGMAAQPPVLAAGATRLSNWA
jgi:hypothetical protein